MTLQTLTQQVKDFLQDEQGLTTVEYAIAGGLVGSFVIAAFVALGGAVDTEIREITTELTK